jgi:hypothetical protein
MRSPLQMSYDTKLLPRDAITKVHNRQFYRNGPANLSGVLSAMETNQGGLKVICYWPNP